MLSEARCTNDRRSAANAVMLELSLADISAAQTLAGMMLLQKKHSTKFKHFAAHTNRQARGEHIYI
jgi:hypothetical protein